MQTRMLPVASVALIGCVLLCAVGNQTARPQEKKEGERTIAFTVSFEGKEHVPVTATLFRNGKAIATGDLSDPTDRGRFVNLVRGDYEVHFEAPGYTTVIKKVALQDQDTPLRGHMVKGKGTVVVGGGPSLQELEARIKKLEEELVKLRGK